ncbi:hypothetical protein GOODEAATRI_025776, partial [Goodea atripinnis]
GDTSVSLQFFLRVMGLSDRFVIFMGTHLSTHRGVMMWPTMIFRGMDFDVVGSTIIVLPGDMGELQGSLPQRRCSCLATSVTDCLSLTVPIFSGSSPPLQRDVLAIRSKICSHSGDAI